MLLAPGRYRGERQSEPPRYSSLGLRTLIDGQWWG
jgi:hypothetical protein